MKSYIYSIIVISVIGGIVTSIVSNKDGSLKKHINLVVGLISTIIFISPIIAITNNSVFIKNGIDSILSVLEVNENINNTNQLIVNTSVENICNGVKEAVISKFNFKESDVLVTAEIDTKNIQAIVINEIKIILSNEASWYDADKVKDYICNLVGCNVNVSKR